MSVLPGATNTTINNGYFTAVSTTNIGAQNDIVGLLHSHSATAGLLDAKERFDAPKCDEGTRISMILGMKKFVQDGGAASSPALYWLHGPAGVGKSALSQSLSLELKREGGHAASFFFSRTSPGRSDGNQLIVTLAYQLATSIPALQPYMSEVVKKTPAVLTASNAVQMQSLIIDPINKWQQEYKRSIWRWVLRIFGIDKELYYPRLILVDGLDECNDRTVQKDLILCIGLAVRQLSIPLRFVIASRPESHILATFELDPAFQGPDGVIVTKKNLGEDEDADEQIATFLLKEFAEIRRVHPIRDFLPQQWPRPEQIEQLVSKSSKVFIYPATVIRYIKMPNNRPDECLERILGLSAIPTFDQPFEPLDALYRHIFESLPEINKTSIHEIFHFLVTPSTLDGVITPSIIERHFSYKPGHVQHVLHDLLCLVAAFTGDGCIKVLHASLPDFLLDQSRSGPLCIGIGDAHATIAASCLLDMIHSDDLPFQVNLLKHMMQANLSNTLIGHRIRQMDLFLRYRRLCWQWLNVPNAELLPIGSWSQDTDSQSSRGWPSLLDMKFPDFRDTPMLGRQWQSLPIADMRDIAYMVTYLLTIVIRHGEQQYIEGQIANIKAYIRQICPFVTSLRLVYDKLIPAMIPLFRRWNSTVFDERINHIFEFEVAPSQYQIREDIFELYFLMMVPFCGVDITLVSRGQGRKKSNKAIKPITWADIVRNVGNDDDADERIMAFLYKEFAEIRRIHPIREFLPEQWPPPHQIEQLVSMSSKEFIFPTTVIQHIKMSNNRPDKCLERILGLSSIPEPHGPFDDLYHHIFESVPEINKNSIHEIFHFLVLPYGITSANTIEKRFGYKPGHVQHVLRDLLCLVAFTRDGYIKVLHASLPDFLRDQSRSGPLYIDVGDVHATIAAAHLLEVIRANEPPDHDKFVACLKHLMLAKLSSTLIRRRILEMDVVSWYKRFCYEKLEVPDAQSPHVRSWALYTGFRSPKHIQLRYLSYMGSPTGVLGTGEKMIAPPSYTIIHALAFMTAYLLVVVIKDGAQQYISNQIAAIKAYVLRICPFLSSDHAVDELIQATTLFFHKWSTRVYDEYINNIFALEVATSQYQIRQDIFELYFLMMLPFCGVNETLALQLIGIKEGTEATKPIDWAVVVQGQAGTNYIDE
ncbi:hypothetical protein D9619_010222 [Psilocybe cf. subviscida]|uniref:Nephrocystin 3-like N-terminal domain-containing protein n=1 Tax=Psilocybe cf. subviscida TaxID=2480587 RepID=A0A8H5AS99_9AGAR|nr:hypothetical protein D9619_010222 [Psilocybe cf. subviscida]